jgi:general stress protein 26
MSSQTEIENKLWSQLKSDRTIMIGLAKEGEGASQPMTAIIEHESAGPIWIFSASDADLVQDLGMDTKPATAQFVSKGHGLFATLHGQLQRHDDQAVVDRLWNPFVAAWYDGQHDPKLRLLRLELEHAHVWLNENSVFAGMKMLFGGDPKKDYKDKTAEISL